MLGTSVGQLPTRVDSNSDIDSGLQQVWHGELFCGMEDVQSSIADLHCMPGAIWLGQTRHQHVGITNGFHLGIKRWVGTYCNSKIIEGTHSM